MLVLVEKRLDPKQSKVYQEFASLMRWADQVRTLEVRANADLPNQAAIAIASIASRNYASSIRCLGYVDALRFFGFYGCRGILGVIDGAPPKGVEVEQDIALRKGLLRQFGYKL